MLLTSLTFAVAAVRLGRLGMLAQRLNATESLASVDTMCFDKTRDPHRQPDPPRRRRAGPGRSEEEVRALLGAMAASAGARNSTMQAIAEGVPAEAEPVAAEVPFASVRKWSAVQLDGRGTIVLGAPDVLERAGVPVPDPLRDAIASGARERRRSSCSPRTSAPLGGEALPAGLEAAGIALLVEGLREDSIGAVAFLASQKVDLKVISRRRRRDGPGGALAAGVPGAERALAGPDIPEDDAGLAAAAEATTVFGRVTPEQKRRLIGGLTARGATTPWSATVSTTCSR